MFSELPEPDPEVFEELVGGVPNPPANYSAVALGEI
jgi:hypothetical protein